ncbi:MAG TPA: DUF397 domain-containing protein [Pseudonocardiaceae bacterium]|jgi:hypothetical protein|nr:DUF397 domain-containing protein [Pseudonocardiaceae bacterium]
MAEQSGRHQPRVWRRASSCSPAGDNCVEVRHRVDVVDVRDSKAVFQMITVGATAWRMWLDRLAADNH